MEEENSGSPIVLRIEGVTIRGGVFELKLIDDDDAHIGIVMLNPMSALALSEGMLRGIRMSIQQFEEAQASESS